MQRLLDEREHGSARDRFGLRCDAEDRIGRHPAAGFLIAPADRAFVHRLAVAQTVRERREDIGGHRGTVAERGAPDLDLVEIRTRELVAEFGLKRLIIAGGDTSSHALGEFDIHALTTLGCAEVRVVGPKTLVPPDLSHMGVKVFHQLEEGIKGCDVVIMLRLQNERMSGALLPSSQEYFKGFGLTPEKLALAKPDAIVMHPGPINRGVEIDSAVVDGPRSVILSQVTFGIAVRMAVMSIVAGNEA